MVEHTRQIVGGLKGFPAEKIEAALSELAAQWQAVESIRRDDDRIIPVDSAYLIALLRAQEPELDRIKDLLGSLQSAHHRYPAEVFTSADLGSLESILARPEFQWQPQGTSPIAEWLAQLWERLNRWLNSLFGERVFSIAVNQGSWTLLTALTSLLLVMVLLYISRNLIMDFVSDARLDEQGNLADETLTSETALQKARELSRGGDYRSAVRYLYLSSLLLLDERGLLHYDRSKTNREYLQSLTGSPELARPLGEVIEVFDNVWYGNHSLDADSFKNYSDRVEELKEHRK
jgi:hypothetical protein